MPRHERLVRPTKSNPFILTAMIGDRSDSQPVEREVEITETKQLPCADSLETAFGKAQWHMNRNKNTVEVRIIAPSSRTYETDDYIAEQQITYTVKRQEQPVAVEA